MNRSSAAEPWPPWEEEGEGEGDATEVRLQETYFCSSRPRPTCWCAGRDATGAEGSVQVPDRGRRDLI